MKQNKNIFPSLGIAAALLIATMFASCTKAELEAPVVKQGAEIRFGIEKNGISKPLTKSGSKSDSRVLVDYDPNDPCSLGLSMTVVDGIETPKSHLPATKGAQVSQKEQLTAFDVVSYFYADESAEDGSLVFADEVSDGVNTTNKTYYWPSFGEMNFIATYPAGLFGDAGIQTIADDNGHLQSFTYTIPQAVEEQQDIMIAMTNDVDCTEGAPVPLQFKHLLAAVQFKVGDMQFIKINSLKVTGVYGGEITFTYDSDDNVWTPSVSTTSSYDLSSIIMDTSGLVEGDDITSTNSNSIMLVAPQTLPAGAQLEVKWTETITNLSYTKTTPLSGGVWEAGKTTVYALNIAGTDFGTVEIPRPDDQDAHYIMLTMSYNMGNILSDDNIKSVKATAQWKKDENGNDVSGNSSLKSGISLKFKSELSETQKQGFWTDKRYKQTITVTSSGSRPSAVTEDMTTDSHGNTGLRGGPYLNIKQPTGDIVLFIEENNGTTDREGELVFTATLISGVEIVLGEGSFKQLCPSWNESGLGVERIENSNTFSYGFSYDRKVTYENSGFYIGVGLIRSYYSYILESQITDDEGSFVTITGGKSALMSWKIQTVVLDYGALNDVSAQASDSDGLVNTVGLYNFTGGNDLDQIEQNLDKYDGQYLTKTINSEGTATPEDYAAFVALSCNRMYELETTITSSSEGTDIQHKPVLYKDGTNNIVEWFLPSSEEAPSLKETGVDCNGEQSVIDNLDGTYWSSTAGADVAPAKANTFVYNANVYSSQNSGPKARTEKYKVRAVRKKPTAN